MSNIVHIEGDNILCLRTLIMNGEEFFAKGEYYQILSIFEKSCITLYGIGHMNTFDFYILPQKGLAYNIQDYFDYVPPFFDKVLCIRKQQRNELTPGKMYEVYNFTSTSYEIVNDKGRQNWYRLEHFANTKEAERKFKLENILENQDGI